VQVIAFILRAKETHQYKACKIAYPKLNAFSFGDKKNTHYICKTNFEAIHNKDYSVVKTLGSLVLQRGIFYAPMLRGIYFPAGTCY
jgi:hypothetical protein